jgi:hypothetical protein
MEEEARRSVFEIPETLDRFAVVFLRTKTRPRFHDLLQPRYTYIGAISEFRSREISTVLAMFKRQPVESRDINTLRAGTVWHKYNQRTISGQSADRRQWASGGERAYSRRTIRHDEIVVI